MARTLISLATSIFSRPRLRLILDGMRVGLLLALYTVLPIWGAATYFFWSSLAVDDLARHQLIASFAISFSALVVYGGIALQGLGIEADMTLWRHNPISLILRSALHGTSKLTLKLRRRRASPSRRLS